MNVWVDRGKKGCMDKCFEAFSSASLWLLHFIADFRLGGSAQFRFSLCPLVHLSKGRLYLLSLSLALLWFSSLPLRTHIPDFIIYLTICTYISEFSLPLPSAIHFLFKGKEWVLSLLYSLSWEMESDPSWNHKFCLFFSSLLCDTYILTIKLCCWETVLKIVSNSIIVLSHLRNQKMQSWAF